MIHSKIIKMDTNNAQMRISIILYHMIYTQRNNKLIKYVNFMLIHNIIIKNLFYLDGDKIIYK
jgi:hypothetical protein